MTSESGPSPLYWIGGAQVTCPLCSAPTTRTLSEPATAGGTVLAVVRCTACRFVMVGADLPTLRPVEWDRDEVAFDPLAGAAFRADERIRLTVPRPEAVVDHLTE
jgi:hypothetical protein